MIFLKNVLKKAFVIFLCGFIFFGASYAYLDYNIKKNTISAEQKEYKVPYARTPENKNLVFVFADDSALLVHLDFDSMGIRLIDIDEFDTNITNYTGYNVDYTIKTDYRLIEGIVDRVGGINLNTNNEMLRYTGVQVVDLISYGCDNTLKRQIINAVFEQIAQNSFSKDDFVYIIENGKTNLLIIDCIYWVDYIKEMSRRINYVN